jgi:hypothetical protein
LCKYVVGLNDRCVSLCGELKNITLTPCLMVGIYLFLILYLSIDIDKMARWFFLFHIISWSYALIASVAPLVADKYQFHYLPPFPLFLALLALLFCDYY